MTVLASGATPSMSTSALPENLRPGTCTVGVLGGTGGQGRGLAYRFGRAGVDVTIGSRSPERAELAAAEILPYRPGPRGAENLECAAAADIVFMAVPWIAHASMLARLAPLVAGKIVVDCCNPLGFDDDGAYALRLPEGSAAEQAAQLLPGAHVVGAFHHVSSTLLLDATRDRLPSLDIMVAGDDERSCATIRSLVDTIPGLRGVFAGSLRNAHQLEALSATLIGISRRHPSYTGVSINGV